jgi:hypothetical protein
VIAAVLTILAMTLALAVLAMDEYPSWFRTTTITGLLAPGVLVFTMLLSDEIAPNTTSPSAWWNYYISSAGLISGFLSPITTALAIVATIAWRKTLSHRARAIAALACAASVAGSGYLWSSWLMLGYKGY